MIKRKLLRRDRVLLGSLVYLLPFRGDLCDCKDIAAYVRECAERRLRPKRRSH